MDKVLTMWCGFRIRQMTNRKAIEKLSVSFQLATGSFFYAWSIYKTWPFQRHVFRPIATLVQHFDKVFFLSFIRHFLVTIDWQFIVKHMYFIRGCWSHCIRQYNHSAIRLLASDRLVNSMKHACLDLITMAAWRYLIPQLLFLLHEAWH